MTEVYTPTTAPNPKSSWIRVPSGSLEKARCGIKVIEVLLSLVAFILEETVHSCSSCSALYFFEFVSCTAFLFTLLLLILLYTSLKDRVGISRWPLLDMVYTGLIGVVLLISSIIFAANNSGTPTEKTAVAFGFLASLMFFVDLGLIVKTDGFPFKKDGKEKPVNGGAMATGEADKLNTPTNEAE